MNIDRLKTLCECLGVSSNEQVVASVLKPVFEENADGIIRDNLGSIFAHKMSKNENAKTFMIACPMDECGLMVSAVNKEEGTLSFIALEDITLASLLHQRVSILCRDNTIVSGVITSKDNSANDLYILCPNADKVTPGDLISYEANFELEDNVIYSKALNPRILNEVCLELVERLKSEELDFNVAIGTMSQSTIGFRGTKTATYVIEPDAALALTVFNDAKINDGVTVGMYDKGMIPSQRLLNDIKSFVDVKSNFNTRSNDGSFIHKTVKGCPTVVVGIACNNLNSANEMVSISDVDALVDMLVKFVLHLNNEMIIDFGFGEHHA